MSRGEHGSRCSRRCVGIMPHHVSSCLAAWHPFFGAEGGAGRFREGASQNTSSSGEVKNLHPVATPWIPVLPQTLFRDSNVDPENFDEMDYAQKRLVLLKSSRALLEADSDAEGTQEDEEEPAVLALQHSAQWGSFRCDSFTKSLLNRIITASSHA